MPCKDDETTDLDVGDIVDLGPVQHGLHRLHTQNRMPQSTQSGQQSCNNMMTKSTRIINKIKLINRCDDKYKSANSKKGKKIKNNKEIIKKLYIKNNY